MSGAPPREEHPSYLELDRIALRSDASASAALTKHLARCEQCAAHVRSVGGAAGRATVPAWVRTLGAERLAKRASFFSGWRAGVFVLAMGGAAAALAVVLARPDTGPLLAEMPAAEVLASRVPALATPHRPYAGVKGSPAVALFVKRGEETKLWDGREHVQPGDRVRLKLAPAGFAYAQVFATDREPGRASPLLTRLHAAPVAGAASSFMLPKAWRVDDAAGPERLVVVLAPRELAAADVVRFLLGETPPPDVWLRTLVLEKRGAKAKRNIP